MNTVDLQNRSLSEGKKELLRIARRAVRMGMQSSTGGNISMRWGDLFLTKATGSSLYGMADADISVIDCDGNPVPGARRPTKEIRFHLGLYRAREDVGGVVHYHSPFATAYAIRGIPVPLLTVQARRLLRRISVVPEAPDGSPELARHVVAAFKDEELRVILLARHGLVAVGGDLSEAQNMAELAEETAKTALLARLVEAP